MFTYRTHICHRVSPLWWWGSRSSTPTSNCVSHSGGSSLNPLTAYNVPASRSQPKKTRNVSWQSLVLLLFLDQKHHLRSLCGWCWGTGRSYHRAFPDVHGPSRNLGWGAGQTSGLYSVWQEEQSLKQCHHRTEKNFRKKCVYLKVKSSPIFFMTSAEDNFTLFPDLSV